MTDTTATYHQMQGPWNRECACGRVFATSQGTVNHVRAQQRKQRTARDAIANARGTVVSGPRPPSATRSPMTPNSA